MGTYKVIQDIEAEDKLLGPLTLKQFIFGVVAVGFAFAAFMAVSKTGNLLVAIPFLPFIAVPALLAAPLGRDQPTDVWLAAQIRFFIKPRKRVWDQSGIKNLVTITAPKKIEQVYTNGLSQQEVKSRLEALASTIDSRGWAVKNVAINMYGTPAYATADSDRLIDPSSLPQSVPETDITAADDIMDASSNPVAQHFDSMVHAAGDAQKAAAIAHMQAAAGQQQAAIDPWFMHQPDASALQPGSAMFTPQTVHPSARKKQQTDSFLEPNPDDEAVDEKQLLKHIKEQKQHTANDGWAHHKTIKTPAQLAAEEAEQKKQQQINKAQAVTPPKNPDIVELANTNDLSVASVAQLAKRKSQDNSGEVVIKLH